MLTFLITSTSLSSKDFLKITVSFSFVTGKTCPGKEPEDVLLSNFYFSSSLKSEICQDEYCNTSLWYRYEYKKKSEGGTNGE